MSPLQGYHDFLNDRHDCLLALPAASIRHDGRSLIADLVYQIDHCS